MKPPGPFLSVVPEPDGNDPELERYLGVARELAEPSAQSRASVARALNAALPPSAPLPAFGTGGLSAARGASLLRAAGPWLALGAVLIGGLGFGLGLLVGQTPGAAPALAAPAAPVSSPAMLDEPSQSTALAPTGPAPRDVPTAATAGSVATVPAAAPRAAARARPAHAASLERRAHGASQPDVAQPASLDFREALEQLRRAREQLEQGRATMSLLLLSELDRSAGELLFDEREALRVLALCATGQTPAARAAARRLEQHSPRSIYARRVATSCIAEEPGASEADDPG